MTIADLAIAQIRTLPDELAAEVLDFIGYLKEKQERAELADLSAAQEDVLRRIWDNPDDEVWDRPLAATSGTGLGDLDESAGGAPHR